MPRHDLSIAAAVFAVVFLTHSVSPSATSADSHWTVLQMHSILTEHNTDLDEYPQELKRHENGAIECIDKSGKVWRAPETGCVAAHSYGWYPIATPVIALPIFAALDTALRVVGPLAAPHVAGASPVIRGFFQRDYVASYPLVEMICASFLIGLASGVMYLLSRLYLVRKWALLVAFLFAYGTAAWSTGSRALWQHGPDMLAVALVLYCLARSLEEPRWAVWSAFPATLAYFIRPTSIVVLGVTALFVLLHRRHEFGRWICIAFATAVPFVAFYLHLYGAPLPSYFHQGSIVPHDAARLVNALAGQCFSASRGMFTFSPVLLFSIAGAIVAVRSRWLYPLPWYLIAIFAGHWWIISSFHDWTAGYCFGPRYFSDITPVFVFFLIPLLRDGALLRRSRPAAAVFLLLAVASIWIHYRGAAVWAVQHWNDGARIEERVWDFHDAQFLRGL